MLKTIKSYSEINSWQSTALKYLEEMEYRISKTEHKDIYQSPNRSNGLRFYYDKTGFEAESRNTAAGWNIGIRLESYGREKKNIYKGGKMISNGSGLTISGKDINIEYKNDISGMRQNFVVKDRVGETGYFTLVFNVSGNADYKVVNDKVLFTKESLRIMDYKDLVVYDSNGRELHAEFNKSEGGFEIRVNDMDAVYPITIDPISVSPEWIGESNQTNAFYGISVASAGDVNGDGYSDMIIGADCFDDGETDEGKIFVYFGSAEGLPLTADWTGQCNQSNAGFGTSVSTAGDVNGDGYSDVIVGAYGFDRGETNEGSAFLYYGSFEGLSKDAVWIGESNQLGAYYGRSVCSAGDVNGDGYGDVIVGSIYYDDKETNEGASFLYYGSQTGLSLNPEWIGEPNQNESFYGISVSTAGDVNGDGFSDVIIGAPYYDNMESDEGCIFLFLGNEGGLSQMIMQKNAESVPIIAPLYSNDYYLKINLNGKDYVGRGKVKLQWEVKDMDRPFDCKGLYESLEWYDTWLSGVNISENITGLTIGKYYKWRVRLIYEKSKGITQNNSRWFYIDDNSPTEADFKNQVYHSKNNHYEYDNHIETQLVVTINEIKYSVLKTANILIIYDITGLVVYKSLNNSKGTHSLSLKSLPTGIYFVSYEEGNLQINKKAVAIK